MLHRTSLGILLLSPVLMAQQDLIYYKFDQPGSKYVINWAGASEKASRLVAPTYGPDHSYVKGRFGKGALAPATPGMIGNFIDTGYVGPLQGSMSFALFLNNRQRYPKESRSGIMGRPGFSLSTGGQWAGDTLTLKGWGGTDLKFSPPGGMHALVGWHHFALVIDGRQKTATWYWNGKPASTTQIQSGVNLAKGTAMHLGRDWYNHCGSRWDLDEFRLLERAATAAEVLSWSRNEPAGFASFKAEPSQPVVDKQIVNGGMPSIGSKSYGTQLTGLPRTVYVFALGFDRVEIPFGKQLWQTSIAVAVAGQLDAQGKASLPLPIPYNTSLVSARFHTQAIFVLDRQRIDLSNAVTHAIGY